ncbi:HipA N-terminal domain-containing protein [Oribacterium sp. HCP3S3_B9]|uniref:HipA N-terminal domain-containing protein n=1 Tax=Oribacterium sp. HCP3S3_B9 TaxID=3438946 RepID=UPI003F88CE43
MKRQVFIPSKDHFDGLFGVFADSLPDNWGRLLLNRLLRAHQQNTDELTVIDRLAIVGKSGMGALTYYPEKSYEQNYEHVDLDELAEECAKILNTTTVDGNGRNPGRKELLAVGIQAGMKKERCEKIIEQIEACVKEMLGEYLK